MFAAVLAGMAGCSTTGGTSFNTTQQDALITAAASTGTAITLTAKPEYKPAFQAASATLGLLSKTNQLTVADIQAALKSVNVQGTSTPVVALAIGDALTLMDAFGIGVQSLPQNQQLSAVQGVAAAAKTGIDQGLILFAPSVSTNSP